jgi:Carbohydrate family 9 binding domain-like
MIVEKNTLTKCLFSMMYLGVVTLVFWGYSCKNTPTEQVQNSGATLEIPYGTPVLDGADADEVWDLAQWQALDQVWIGAELDSSDFKGRYKVLWDENNLYLLAEITDDTLIDIHADGLDRYWDDDCLELFVDEDASGGNHQYNHNAFAYHIALDGKVADIATDSTKRYYDDHCLSRRISRNGVSIWEVAIKIFDGNQYTDGSTENIPKMLSANKLMGFAVAYCDNDRSAEREHFIGSEVVLGDDKNRGWIDAGIFGKIQLK